MTDRAPPAFRPPSGSSSPHAAAGAAGHPALALPPSARPTTPANLGGGRPAREPGPSATILNFADLPNGTMLLDRFRIVRKVGSGGFGVVYLVEDAAIQDELILKILNPHLSIDENAAQRFVQELKLRRRITHPSVIRIHDFLDLGGAHAVSMEYFPGRDLGHGAGRGGPLDIGRGLGIVSQVCEGLTPRRTRVGVVHRDIKPGNILVGEGDA